MSLTKISICAATVLCMTFEGLAFAATPVGNTSYSPAAAVFNNSLWVASTYGNLLSLEQLDLFGNIVATVPIGLVADRGPRIEAFNGVLYIFYRCCGSGSPVIRYRTMTTANVVSAESIIPGSNSDVVEAGTTVFNNRLYVAEMLPGGSVAYTYLNTSGAWNGWIDTGGDTAHAPDFAVANGTLFVTYGGQSSPSSIYYQTISPTNVIGAPTQVPFGVYERSGPVGTEFQSKLYVVYRGHSSDRLWFNTMTSGGVWSATAAIGSGKTSAGPGVVVFANKLWVFFKGLTSNTKYFEQIL